MRPIGDEMCRLIDAWRSGELSDLCRHHGLHLMVLFGSSVTLFDAATGARQVRSGGDPATSGIPHRSDVHDADIHGSGIHDIDIAVDASPGHPAPDPLALLQAMYELTASERIDVLVLRRAGPVARQRALSRGRKLFEAGPGVFAEAQIAAIMEYFDTEPLRELSRRLLASSRG